MKGTFEMKKMEDQKRDGSMQLDVPRRIVS